MKKSILKEYTKIGLQEYLAEKDKDFIDSFADKECSADFSNEGWEGVCRFHRIQILKRSRVGIGL